MRLSNCRKLEAEITTYDKENHAVKVDHYNIDQNNTYNTIENFDVVVI